MSNTAALKDFATQQRDRLLTRKNELQTALDADRADLTQKRNEHQALLKEVAELEQDIEATRNALAQILMPADGDAAVEELRQLLVRHRRRRHALQVLGHAIELAKVNLQRKQQHATALADELALAEQRLTEASTRHQRHQDWEQQLADEPLSTIRDQADHILNPPPAVDDESELPKIEAYQTAKIRIAGEIPETLRNRARERGEQVDERLGAYRAEASETDELVVTQREIFNGPDANLNSLWEEFRAAEAGLAHYVQHATERLAAAVSLAHQINQSTLLTTAERERIDGTSDPDLVTQGEGAIEKEKARDEKQFAFEQARAELEKKIRELKAEDIDVDVSADDDVDNLQEEVNDAEEELAAAEAEFTPELRNALDAWEAAVPDHIWKNLVSFFRATRILSELKDTDPQNLRTQVDEAETALLEGLTAAEKHLRTFDFLTEQQEFGHARLQHAEQTHRLRELSAVRGDQ